MEMIQEKILLFHRLSLCCTAGALFFLGLSVFLFFSFDLPGRFLDRNGRMIKAELSRLGRKNTAHRKNSEFRIVKKIIMVHTDIDLRKG